MTENDQLKILDGGGVRNDEVDSNEENINENSLDETKNLPSSERDFTSVQEIFRHLQQQKISTGHVVKSITYDEISQTYIIQMGKLLKEEAKSVKRSRPRHNITNDLKRLSESFREQYPSLLDFFRNWKPCRKELIEASTSFADKMDRNFTLVSTFRILTSVADIVGSLMQPNASRFHLASLAMDNAPALALGSLFLEITAANKMYSQIKKIARRDQELFERMKIWFRQTEELDRAVRNFFPYGIDEELLRRINKESRISDTFSKLFMCIVASNAEKNEELFQDEEFLGKATSFATSEAGMHWYNKVLLDPIWRDCFNSRLSDEIGRISTSLQNPTIIGLDVSNMLYRKQQTKFLLNAITIYSAVSDLWNDAKSENSDTLRQVAIKSRRELEAMQNIMRLLKPEGIDISDALF